MELDWVVLSFCREQAGQHQEWTRETKRSERVRMSIRTRWSMHALSDSSRPEQPSLACPAEAQQSIIGQVSKEMKETIN